MDRPVQPPKEIRDPLHGAIAVDEREMAVIEHEFVQRLRGIGQLGFSHLAFPGATHTRYCHSLGAMHLAGRAFDACFRDDPFESTAHRLAYRHCVRLAALCHDLGHPPMSHAAEFAMPSLASLGIDVYDAEKVAARLDARASHEDYTVAILTQSSLAETIAENFPFGAHHVAALVSHEVELDDDFFSHSGFCLRGLLSQLISSDLDVDRLDYLVRDSYFSGARYGEVDVNWLVSNMARHVDAQGRVALALDRRAIYAFDDFMIARFHMFVMVYFHQRSVAYEELLKRFMRAPDCAYTLPSDLDAYLETDDAQLMAHLRAADNPWAKRIVDQRPFRVVWEGRGPVEGAQLDGYAQRLEAANIDAIAVPGKGVVYGQRKPGMPEIYALNRMGEDIDAVPMNEATAIFSRYQDERCVARLYVDSADRDRARVVLRGG
jgi:HD superfamily phosphohydrolase